MGEGAGFICQRSEHSTRQKRLSWTLPLSVLALVPVPVPVPVLVPGSVRHTPGLMVKCVYAPTNGRMVFSSVCVCVCGVSHGQQTGSGAKASGQR